MQEWEDTGFKLLLIFRNCLLAKHWETLLLLVVEVGLLPLPQTATKSHEVRGAEGVRQGKPKCLD